MRAAARGAFGVCSAAAAAVTATGGCIRGDMAKTENMIRKINQAELIMKRENTGLGRAVARGSLSRLRCSVRSDLLRLKQRREWHS